MAILAPCSRTPQTAAVSPPRQQRPAWLKQGIVMAGNWETLGHSLRNGLSAADEVEEFKAERTEEVARQLKALDVTLVTTSFYTGSVCRPLKIAGRGAFLTLQTTSRVLRTLQHILLPLQLAGVLEYEGANLLKGSVVRGETQVRQMSELKLFRPTRGYTRVPVELNRLEHAARLRDGLEDIDAPPYTAKRVIRGLNVLMDGLQQMNSQERIHQFVRSLEALIMPDTGKTRRQFVNRCQTFVKAGHQPEAVLNEAFNMRSDTEHLHDWEGSLQAYAEKDRENVAFTASARWSAWHASRTAGYLRMP